MNEMQVFQNSEFGELGVLEVNGKAYFPATACAKTLGYKRPADAITAHCKGSVKYRVLTNGGEQELKFIPEGDLYRLIVHSKLPAAERFEKWVFDEVLPSIRQTGGYGNPTAEQPKLAEQMSQAATAMIQVATAMITVVDKLTDLMDRMSNRPTPQPWEPVHKSADRLKRIWPGPVHTEIEVDTPAPTYYGPARCKLESFPPQIVRQVQEMMTQMQEQQNLNFSMIARFCTVNGHSISSPAVKTYYQKYFSED